MFPLDSIKIIGKILIKNRFYSGNQIQNFENSIMFNIFFILDQNSKVLEYIETANLIAELPEDAALGFLLANNYEMRECLENLTKIKHSNGQHNEDKIPAYFQNLIFTEHQLNISKSIFSKDVVDKLFLHYYTKQIRPPSYSEVLMINREEDTSLINLIGQRLNFDNTSPSGVDLGAALSICYENRQNLTFDVTKLDQFKRRRQHIVSIRKNLQKHRQKNHQRLFELKANFADYWKFLYFLRNSKKNPLWNIYEVIIFISLIEIFHLKIDFHAIASILRTKNKDQCEKFYGKHKKFIEAMCLISNPCKRIKEIKNYMRLP
ncbi:hypothetical protein SSS_09648 [Sarcoptes scabiei]|nr:hypothetical protein SSS_09648 [Sarcoptes scabiei]